MDYSRQNISNYYLYDTQVENLFIAEYMASAPGEFVKAYLLASMYAQLNMPADDRIIAKAAGVAPEKMEECWAYWEGRGVVRRIYEDPENSSSCRVEFINLREEVFGSREPAAKKSAAARLDDKALARLYCPSGRQGAGPAVPRRGSRRRTHAGGDGTRGDRILALRIRHDPGVHPLRV